MPKQPRERVIFFARGEIRGRCPHDHRTETGAWRCLDDDMAGCRSQGGYSDRHVYRAVVITAGGCANTRHVEQLARGDD